MTAMELTILGSSASSPDAGDACAGYLVRQGDTQLLLDCGSGVLGQLRRHTSVDRLTAIVISHFHPDHFIDLVPMRYGLRYGWGDPVRPRLFVPPGGRDYLADVGAALRGAPKFFSASYDVREFDPDAALEIGEFSISFQRTTHDVPTWGCAVQGTGRLVYTADTQESADLKHFAFETDVLLCEATYPAGAGALPSGNHLTSAQAGALARRAGARQLVLTHFWPGIDRSVFAAEAERAFQAPVVIARPGLTLTVAGAPVASLGRAAGAIATEELV
jgi:ribonuclease BN (tRNA processing enzyme)